MIRHSLLVLTILSAAPQPQSADFSVCAIVNPGPLKPSNKPVLYPRNSSLT